eukprot:1322330-Amphidinium_carterae.1
MRGTDLVARLLCGFTLADDRKTQSFVDSEFTGWKSKQELGKQLTGVLLFQQQTALVGMHKM